MSNQDKNALMTVEFEVDGSRVKLSPTIVKEYITDGQALSDSEYKFFVEMAKARKLNPFLKEIYAIKYSASQPAQIVVGKDAILKRAIQHPQYDGREQGIIILKEDGTVEERPGTFKLHNEQLVGGWARVYRKDIAHPTYISVSFDEVAQRKGNGELNSNWANKGATMVEKVALVRALRETFVEDLGGMIDADEAWNIKKDAEVVEAEVVEEAQVSLATENQLNQIKELYSEEEISEMLSNLDKTLEEINIFEASKMIQARRGK